MNHAVAAPRTAGRLSTRMIGMRTSAKSLFMPGLQFIAVCGAVGAAMHGDGWLARVVPAAAMLVGIATLAADRALSGPVRYPRSALRATGGFVTAAAGTALLGPPDPAASWVGELRWAVAGFAAVWVCCVLLDTYYCLGRRVAGRTAAASDEHDSKAVREDSPTIAALDSITLVAYGAVVALYQVGTAAAFLSGTLMIWGILAAGIVLFVARSVRPPRGERLVPLRQPTAFLWLGLTFFGQVWVGIGHRFPDPSYLPYLIEGWLITGASGAAIVWLTVVRRRFAPSRL